MAGALSPTGQAADEPVRGEVGERRAPGERQLEVELGAEVAQHLGHAVGAGERESVDVRPADADRRRPERQRDEDVCARYGSRCRR